MDDALRIAGDALSAVWRFVTTNPEILADYGTFLSALTALVVAIVTLVQLRLNRKQVRAAQAQVGAAQEQVRAAQEQASIARSQQQVADKSLHEAREAVKQAAYARLDSHGPMVAVINLGSPRIAPIKEEEIRRREFAFSEENEAKFPKYFDLEGASEYRHWDLVASGRLRVQNHGSVPALFWLAVEHEWHESKFERDAARRYIIPPGESADLTWYDQTALSKFVDHPKAPGKTYVYGEFRLYSNSLLVGHIEDSFLVEYICKPLFKPPVAQGLYQYDASPPQITLGPRLRNYGDQHETADRVFDEWLRS